MKFATYKDNSRDGCLHIVSQDMTKTTPASAVKTLQEALDHWDTVVDKLQAEYDALNNGQVDNISDFNSQYCAAPLPRAYQWVDGSAYVNHVELVRKARGAVLPDTFWEDPLMYQGGSDSMLGAHDDIPLGDKSWGMDMEAEIVVFTGDVPAGTTPQEAEHYIRLVGCVNDVSMRGLIPDELAKGFGFLQSKPPTAFSPVVVTLDELNGVWQDGTINGTMEVDFNGQPLGRTSILDDCTFNMTRLISHAAKTRPLGAGSIVGSGTISNRDANGGPGKPIANGGLGYSCLAEIRCVETILHGKPKTPFMVAGDKVRIAVRDANGNNLFGDINQKVIEI